MLPPTPNNNRRLRYDQTPLEFKPQPTFSLKHQHQRLQKKGKINLPPIGTLEFTYEDITEMQKTGLLTRMRGTEKTQRERRPFHDAGVEEAPYTPHYSDTAFGVPSVR